MYISKFKWQNFINYNLTVLVKFLFVVEVMVSINSYAVTL